jgi:hypothetical protein
VGQTAKRETYCPTGEKPRKEEHTVLYKPQKEKHSALQSTNCNTYCPAGYKPQKVTHTVQQGANHRKRHILSCRVKSTERETHTVQKDTVQTAERDTCCPVGYKPEKETHAVL